MSVLGVLTRGMLANEQALQYQSLNIVNMNTPGYRAAQVDFKTLLRSLDVGRGIAYSDEPGAYVATEQGLDIYLQPGVYMAVQNEHGVMYGRYGRLQLSQDGALLDGNGNKVLLDGNIGNFSSLHVDTSGAIWAGKEKVATLNLVHLGAARPDADGYIREYAREENLPSKPVLPKGFEASNVNFTDEVVALMINVRQMNGLQYAYKSIEGIYDKALTDLGRF